MPANLLESLIVDSKLWYVGNPLPNCFQTRNPETEILTLKSKLLNGQKQKLSYWKKKKKEEPTDTNLKLLQKSHYKAFYFSLIWMLSSHQLRNNVKLLFRHRHLCHLTTYRNKLARNLDCQGQAAIFKHSQGTFSREITHMLLYANKQLLYKLSSYLFCWEVHLSHPVKNKWIM